MTLNIVPKGLVEFLKEMTGNKIWETKKLANNNNNKIIIIKKRKKYHKINKMWYN